MVSFINDQKIEAGSFGLSGPVGVPGKEFSGTENELAVEKGVAGLFTSLKGSAALLIKESKQEIESPQEFYEPLVNKGFRDQNKDAISAASEVQAMENEAGFYGLAEAYLVGEQESGREAPGRLVCDSNLVRDEIDTRSGEAPGRGAEQAAVLLKRLGAQFKGAKVVALAGEQAFLWLNETQRVKKVFFRDFVVPGVIDEESRPLLHSLYREFGCTLVLDTVAFLEVNPDEGGGRKHVLAHFLGGRKADLNPVSICGDDYSEAKFRLGSTDPALAG